MLIALVLAVTLPNANENDPSRPLTISNSAVDPDNRILFYAAFGQEPSSAIDFDVSKQFTTCEHYPFCVHVDHTVR